MPQISTTNNYNRENPFSASKIINDEFTKNQNNPFMATATSANYTLTILSEQYKKDDPQLGTLNQYESKGNGYQKLPFRSPVLHQNIEGDQADDHNFTTRVNRMHTQSPQLPRKSYELNSSMNNIHPPQPLQPHHENQSPYMLRKFQTDEDNFGNKYNTGPFKPPQLQSTFSPVIRKRYQEGTMNIVSEDLEFRILHGNTSPIVLQRFYHQQNQLKDQKEEDQLRSACMQPTNPNPFKNSHNNIPVKGGSPLLNTRYPQMQPTQMYHRNMVQQHQEPSYNASHKTYESHIPHLQARLIGNGATSRHLSQNQQQPICDNINHRSRIPCPNSPWPTGLRANLEKPNFYERHQLPVQIESSCQMNLSRNPLQNGSFSTENQTKEKGMK